MKGIRTQGLRGIVRKYIIITLGAALYGFAASLFFAKNGILSGGITGVSIVLNQLFRFPIGTVILILNLPLFVLGWVYIGRRFMISTLYATVVLSLSADLFALIGPLTDDVLLASVFGGLIGGAGLGLVFTQGATTGGTDIITRLIHLKFNYVPMGKLVLGVDVVVVALGAAVLSNVNSALYAVIAMYVSSVAIDGLLYGIDYAKVAYIISDRADEVASTIIRDLGRGVTMLYGRGVYTGNDKKILLCAIKRQQIAKLKNTVSEIDPEAFLIVTEAHEVLGYGFGDPRKEL